MSKTETFSRHWILQSYEGATAAEAEPRPTAMRVGVRRSHYCTGSSELQSYRASIASSQHLPHVEQCKQMASEQTALLGAVAAESFGDGSADTDRTVTRPIEDGFRRKLGDFANVFKGFIGSNYLSIPFVWHDANLNPSDSTAGFRSGRPGPWHRTSPADSSYNSKMDVLNRVSSSKGTLLRPDRSAEACGCCATRSS